MSDKTPEEKLASRIARWETYGVEAIKNDLMNHHGIKLVGGSPSVRDQAWDWVRQQEVKLESVELGSAVELKPGIWGISFDLKQGYSWMRTRWRNMRRRK